MQWGKVFDKTYWMLLTVYSMGGFAASLSRDIPWWGNVFIAVMVAVPMIWFNNKIRWVGKKRTSK